MDLIDRYLHAVRSYLPRSMQDDVVGELAEDLRAQAAERGEALGRPLTDSELAAIVRPYGHPMLLAARYRPKQYLIGPTVYPFYIRILKLVLVAVVLVHAALAVAFAVMGEPLSRSLGALGNTPFAAVVAVGWLTAIFALADVFVPRLPFVESWDPLSLPAPAPGPVVSRVNTALELLATSAFLAWWLALPRAEWLAFGPADRFLTLGPAMDTAYLPVLVILLLSLLRLAAVLVRPYQTTFWRAARIALSAAGIVLIVSLLDAGGFVALQEGADSPQVAAIVPLLNRGMTIGLAIAAAMNAWEIVRDVARLATGRQQARVQV
ncbi:MAG TPA: hypothetical protein VF198_15290 [Vicinamibacterales bacterium]